MLLALLVSGLLALAFIAALALLALGAGTLAVVVLVLLVRWRAARRCARRASLMT